MIDPNNDVQSMTPENREELSTPLTGFMGERQRGVRALWNNPDDELLEISPTVFTASAYSHVTGYSTRLHDLYDQMMMDAKISSSMSDLVSRAMSLEQVIEFKNREDNESPAALRVLEFVRSVIAEEHIQQAFRLIALRTLVHGHGNFEVVWSAQPGDKIVPAVLTEVHPSCVRFSAGESLPSVFIADGKEVTMHRGKFVRCVWSGLYGSPYGGSILFPLRRVWYSKQKLMRRREAFCETHGTPLILFKINTGGNYQQEAFSLETQIKNLDLAMGLIVPANISVEAVQRSSGGMGGGTGQTAHDGHIDRLDTYLRLAITGETLTAEAGARGARSLGVVHERTANERAQAVGTMLSAGINQWFIPALVRWNFGNSAPIPRYTLGAPEQVDLAANAEALKSARDVGVPVPLSQARTMLNIQDPVPGEPVIVGGHVSVEGQQDDEDEDGLHAMLGHSQQRIDEAYSKYHAAVNMTASQLSKWAETECSRKASLSRAPIKRNLRLLRKGKAQWTVRDAREAMRTVSFVSRMKGAMGDLDNKISKDCPFTKAEVSLANWAWATPRIKRALSGRASASSQEED